MGEIIYNGQSSKDIGLEVETFPEYSTPKRDYEKIHIPGRNGDFLHDNGCWENATRSYEVSIASFERDYFEMMNRVSDWLHSALGYCRLEDSYEPDVFRYAVFLEENTMSNVCNAGGKSTISFDCKPQRYLKSGEKPLIFTKQTTIINPTRYASAPLIDVFGTGSGSVTVGGKTVAISNIGGEIVIDCETQDAYLGTTNKNSLVSLPSGFPTIPVGSSDVIFSGGVTRVEVTPRWYTL